MVPSALASARNGKGVPIDLAWPGPNGRPVVTVASDSKPALADVSTNENPCRWKLFQSAGAKSTPPSPRTIA